ncbi:hypothetical protein BASA61_004560 [Batrachochytrium salamandrivorans]|nr:hypothetical protein BASA61_004560 [Batrachochytrium salamandrivorans]
MVPETSPAIDTTIYKLAAYLPLRRVGIFPAMQSALNRIGGMIQRNRELRQTPDSLQQVPTVAKLQYTCSTSIAWSLHLASNKRIETAGDNCLSISPMPVAVIIAGAKAAYDQICQQSFDTEEPLLLGYIVQGASPSLAKRR